MEWHRLDKMGFEWEASRGEDEYKKYMAECLSVRALRWWHRLSTLGEWDDKALRYWARLYEENQIEAMFGIETKSLKELDEQMLTERSR